jgi:hypothetical protein
MSALRGDGDIDYWCAIAMILIVAGFTVLFVHLFL